MKLIQLYIQLDIDGMLYDYKLLANSFSEEYDDSVEDMESPD